MTSLSRLEALRPYQCAAHSAVLSEMESGRTASLLHMVMGSGKTETAFAVMESAGGALFLVSRVDLVQQTAARFGEHCGVWCASLGQKTIRRVTFASPRSLREIAELPKFPLVVVDEAHRCTGDFRRLVEALQAKGSHVLGLSATPWPVLGKGHLFPKVTYEFGIAEALKAGYLVRPRMRGSAHAFDPREIAIKLGDFDAGQLGRLVSGEKKIEQQVDEALELARGRNCCVWACINIRHAELVTKLLGARGETAVAFHSELTMEERERRMWAFKNGLATHLVFVTIVAEGFDHPPIDTVILMRPTRSAVLAIQIVGRALRPSPGKTDALVLDYGRIFEAIGPLDAPIIVRKGEKKGDAYKLPPFKFCPGCYAYVASTEKSCPECKLQAPPQAVLAKNLDARASSGRLLSDEASLPVERRVERIRCRAYKAQSGRTVISISYILQDFPLPINEYLALGEPWQFGRARDRLASLNLEPKAITEILRKPKLIETMTVPTPYSIKYCYRGKYPEIIEVKHEEKRSHDGSAPTSPRLAREEIRTGA